MAKEFHFLNDDRAKFRDNKLMKRPYLISFTAIASDDLICVRASVTDSDTPWRSSQYQNQSPIQSIGLLSSNKFKMLIIGLSETDETLLEKEFESDSFGNFNFSFVQKIGDHNITKLNVYEASKRQGLSLHLGSFIPQVLTTPKKIVISDFDKTLCDTKYSSPKEVYQSLRKPLSYFPRIEKSIKLLKEHIDNGFSPFILSASPHFYANAIRDWLYQNQIYDGNIFLKDYRSIFAFADGVLTPKDVKHQGFYKLYQIINILNMTGVPEELVLMGDGFESDAFIYLIVVSLLQDKIDPWVVWNHIKSQRVFDLTTKQTFHFLNQFYGLSEKAKKLESVNIKVFIRCNEIIHQKCIDSKMPFEFLQKNHSQINFYLA